MLRRVVVLLRDENALCGGRSARTLRSSVSPRTLEEVLVDDAPVLLADDHAGRRCLEGAVLVGSLSDEGSRLASQVIVMLGRGGVHLGVRAPIQPRTLAKPDKNAWIRRGTLDATEMRTDRVKLCVGTLRNGGGDGDD